MRGELFKFSKYNSFRKAAEFQLLLRIGIVKRSEISRLVIMYFQVEHHLQAQPRLR